MSISTPRNTPKKGAFFKLTPEAKKEVVDRFNSALRITPENVEASTNTIIEQATANLAEAQKRLHTANVKVSGFEHDALHNQTIVTLHQQQADARAALELAETELKKAKKMVGGKKKKRTQRHKKKRSKKTRSYKRRRY